MRTDISEARAKMRIRFGSNRELRKLETYLRPGEQVEALCGGTYENGRGLLVVTNTRILFVKNGWFNQATQNFPFRAVNSVEWKSKLIFGTLVIFGDGSVAQITKVWRADGAETSQLINNLSGTRDQTWQDHTETAFSGYESRSERRNPPTLSPQQLNDLERLGRLREQNILTEEEVVALKQEIFEGKQR